MGKRAERPQVPAGARDSGAKGHGAAPDAVRERAIVALLAERTIALAAARCGLNEKTLRRWLAEDAQFRADYETARRATFDAGISRVQALTAKAVDTLEDLLGAERFPAVRLGAARTIAEIGIHQHDAEVIMRKLDEIEQQLQSGRR